MPKLIAGLLLASLPVLGLPALAGAEASGATSSVYVVHGLPLDDQGTLVDVWAGAAGGQPGDAGLIADDFAFGSTAGPLELTAGGYRVFVAAPNASGDGVLAADEVLFDQDLDVPAGLNLSAVASFDAAGAPTINVFVNDVRRLPRILSRVSVRHAAAAPAVEVDVSLDIFGRRPDPVFATLGPLANGQAEDAILVSFLKYNAAVRVAGTSTEVDRIESYRPAGRTLTAVYAVGVPGSTFGFVVQQIRL